MVRGANRKMTKEKNYKVGAMSWLWMADYIRAWMDRELGGAARAHDKRVVSVQHLEGAREILRMETVEDMMEKQPLGPALSATRMRCMEAGLRIDPDVMRETYGVTPEALDGYVPIECPKICLTKDGVLRPWTFDVAFGMEQARALQKLLRKEFWKAVETFDRDYAEEQRGRNYSAREMIEEFCEEYCMPDLYVESIRREWQRSFTQERDAP